MHRFPGAGTEPEGVRPGKVNEVDVPGRMQDLSKGLMRRVWKNWVSRADKGQVIEGTE